MNKVKIIIWGRELELGIKYDCYSGEKVLESQTEALNKFLNLNREVDFSLEEVKKYCTKMNRDEIGTDTIENIFKYVVPKYLYVSREKEKHVVAIMCNYKFDMENGIAVVFENEQFNKMGTQDIIL